MNVTTVGIDLAKSVFQVHGVDERARVALRKQLKRAEVRKFFANLPPCLIGMEACGSAHYWARELSQLGHEVKLMSPQFVKPYVKTNKNDRNDAEGICEAVQRPNMRFVPIKTLEQQALLAVHRARAGVVKARTAQANQMRGLLAEFGIVLPQGIQSVCRRVPEILEDAHNALPALMRHLLRGLLLQLKELDRQAAELEGQIRLWHREHADSRKLEQIPGIGPLSASALVASLGSAHSFSSGRQVAAWLGLVPRQASSGGKTRLRGISKRGDVYVRTLLIHGARAVLRQIERRAEPADSWLGRLRARRGKNVAAVALANKNARIAWALLARQREFQPDYLPAGPSR
jgi:transposase